MIERTSGPAAGGTILCLHRKIGNANTKKSDLLFASRIFCVYRTVGRHALMPPPLPGRCADGSIRRSTPTNLHRIVRAAIGRPRQWKSQVPTRAHMQCAPTSRPAVLCSKGRLWVQFPVECGETTRFANSTADSLTVRLRKPPPFATMSAR